jgi:hypothetical protein
MANKFAAITTPVGEALFCRTKSTEIIQGKDTGKFSLLLKLSEADTKKLAERIHAEWESARNSEFADKKCSGEMSDGLREYNDETYFKFSCNESYKTKQGEIVHLTVPIFDTAGKEISAQLDEIGNGSKIKVAAKLVPYHMTAKNFGISLRLTAIQVIDYVPYGSGNAESFGFTSDGEGFRAEAAPEDDVPFFDSGAAESDGSDF